MNKIDIVITMGGRGTRFRKMGYDIPKYMIEVKGRTLFEWSMISLEGYSDIASQYIFVVMKDEKQDVGKFIDEKCERLRISNYHIIVIDYLTDGQASTAMLAMEYWNEENGLLIYNIDTYVEAGEMKSSGLKGDGFIPCFKADGEHWSFVKIDDNGKAIEVKEKERISDYCTLGAYYFKECRLYKELYSEYYMNKKNLINGEKYVAPLYNHLIMKGQEVYISDIDKSKVHVLGTPEEVNDFLNVSSLLDSQYIIRNKDIITGETDFEVLYTFLKFPVYMGTTCDDITQDITADMCWNISKGSGMIQLSKLVPDNILYKKSHNAGIGAVWKEHYDAFADFIHENVEDGSTIIEIGGGNGILNVQYCDKWGIMNWIIVEPSKVKNIPGCTAKYIHRFWDEKFDTKQLNVSNKVLVHSHMFEHVMNPNGFMNKNAAFLNDGERMIFSIPNLKEGLKRKYTNALNFEHTFFISDDYVEFLLQKYQFKIMKKKLFREDHSIFYYVVKDQKMLSDLILDGNRLYIENKKLFEEYIDYYKELIESLNEKIEKEVRPIYLFGAHIFSQFLIQMGLNINKIICILDNDILKQEQRLYGTQLTVKSPTILRDNKNSVVILKVASYAEEIKKDIADNINPNVEFWE